MSCVDAYSLKLSTSGTSSDFLEYKSTQWREVTIAFLLGQASGDRRAAAAARSSQARAAAAAVD